MGDKIEEDSALARASTRLCSSDMTFVSSITKVSIRELANSVAASVHYTWNEV